MWQPFEWLWAEPGMETAINNFQRYYSLPDLIFFLSFYPWPSAEAKHNSVRR